MREGRNQPLPSNNNGANVAGRVIAFFGILVIIVGLVLYFYVERIGMFSVYAHRDLGVLLIPTGIALLFGGIALHSVQKKETIVVVSDQSGALVNDLSKTQPDSSPVSVLVEKADVQMQLAKTNQIIESRRDLISAAREKLLNEEVSKEAFEVLEKRKSEEIEDLSEIKAHWESVLLEIELWIERFRKKNLDRIGTGELRRKDYDCEFCKGKGSSGLAGKPCDSCQGTGDSVFWRLLSDKEKIELWRGRKSQIETVVRTLQDKMKEVESLGLSEGSIEMLEEKIGFLESEDAHIDKKITAIVGITNNQWQTPKMFMLG